MKRKLFIIIPIFLVSLIATSLYYLNWDNLLFLYIQEKTNPHNQKSSVWLDKYQAEIADKHIDFVDTSEISGLTWHASSNTLFGVTGHKPSLVQLSLDGELINEIKLPGIVDPEGVVALSDGRLAVIDESNASLCIFNFPAENKIENLVQIDLYAHAKELLNPTNKGLEGIAWDKNNSRFILAKEKEPRSLYGLYFDLATNKVGDLLKLPFNKQLIHDISGLEIDNRTGHLLTLSHESDLLLEIDVQGQAISFMTLLKLFNGLDKGIKQSEGVAIDNNGTIYIVGEPDVFYRFAPAP